MSHQDVIIPEGSLTLLRDVVVFRPSGGDLPSSALEAMIDQLPRGPVGLLVAIGEDARRPSVSLARDMKRFFRRYEGRVVEIAIWVVARGFAGSLFLSTATQLIAMARLSIPARVVTDASGAVASLRRHGLLGARDGSCDADRAVQELEAVLSRWSRGANVA